VGRGSGWGQRRVGVGQPLLAGLVWPCWHTLVGLIQWGGSHHRRPSTPPPATRSAAASAPKPAAPGESLAAATATALLRLRGVARIPAAERARAARAVPAVTKRMGRSSARSALDREITPNRSSTCVGSGLITMGPIKQALGHGGGRFDAPPPLIQRSPANEREHACPVPVHHENTLTGGGVLPVSGAADLHFVCCGGG
jgi:hypothetical protein